MKIMFSFESDINFFINAEKWSVFANQYVLVELNKLIDTAYIYVAGVSHQCKIHYYENLKIQKHININVTNTLLVVFPLCYSIRNEYSVGKGKLTKNIGFCIVLIFN